MSGGVQMDGKECGRGRVGELKGEEVTRGGTGGRKEGGLHEGDG